MKVTVSVGEKDFQGTAQPVIVPVRPRLWMHKDDIQLNGITRSCASCPQVFWLQESRVDLTRQWQSFCRAINYNMPVGKVAAIWGDRKAFCNLTGLGDPNKPRADYLQNENITSPPNLPQFDKVRTCARSVMTGIVSGTQLIVKMFDGNQPPPLKPGRSYPQRVEDIQIDDYLFNPREHRWLFFAANNINIRGGTVPFDHGAVYDWTGDGTPRVYTWLPHVSRFEVRYALSKLIPVPDDAPIPSPYLFR